MNMINYLIEDKYPYIIQSIIVNLVTVSLNRLKK